MKRSLIDALNRAKDFILALTRVVIAAHMTLPDGTAPL